MLINEITNYGAVPKGTNKIKQQNITTRTTTGPRIRQGKHGGTTVLQQKIILLVNILQKL